MSMKQKCILAIMVGVLMAVLTSCCGNPPIDPKKVNDIQTQAGRHLPYEIKNNIPTLDLNYYKDYDIATLIIDNKTMVIHWFWMWAIFTGLLCGFTELAVYIPKVGWLFKFIGKRFSSLVGAMLVWLLIRYLLGGGLVFTTVVTFLALLSANVGWELIVNWIIPKITKKNHPT